MAYQFIHMESYSRKGDANGRTTAFVLAEARRDPASSVHVPKPAAPVVVFGVQVDEVETMHDGGGCGAYQAQGRQAEKNSRRSAYSPHGRGQPSVHC